MAAKKNDDAADPSTTTAPSENTDNVLYPEVTTLTEEQAAQAARERDEQLLNDPQVQGRTEPPASEYRDVNTPGRGSDPNLHAADQPHPVTGFGDNRNDGSEQTREAKSKGDA